MALTLGFLRRRAAGPTLTTPRLTLRPPVLSDHVSWARVRRASEAFLKPWEPAWAADHLSERAFRERVAWAARAVEEGRAYPFLLIRGEAVLGAITLDNIRRGPAQTGATGYWIGAAHARQGYMREALTAVRAFAFGELGLSRLEAACLPENTASRVLLERCGYAYEGVAESFLQIDGRWRTHVLYAALREDRRPQSRSTA
jgi:ribosomal-protein-alanine N-acetyltransferase